MIKIIRTRNSITNLGEIDKKIPVKVFIERLDLNGFDELYRYERLTHPKAKVRIYYDKGEPYIVISGAYYREEIKEVKRKEM